MSIHRVLRSIDPEVETEHFEAQIGSHDFLEMNISVKGMEMSWNVHVSMRAPSANFCKVAPFFSCFGVFHGIGMIQAHVKPWVIIYHNHHIYHSPFVLAVWTLQVQRVQDRRNRPEPVGTHCFFHRWGLWVTQTQWGAAARKAKALGTAAAEGTKLHWIAQHLGLNWEDLERFGKMTCERFLKRHWMDLNGRY